MEPCTIPARVAKAALAHLATISEFASSGAALAHLAGYAAGGQVRRKQLPVGCPLFSSGDWFFELCQERGDERGSPARRLEDACSPKCYLFCVVRRGPTPTPCRALPCPRRNARRSLLVDVRGGGTFADSPGPAWCAQGGLCHVPNQEPGAPPCATWSLRRMSEHVSVYPRAVFACRGWRGPGLRPCLLMAAPSPLIKSAVIAI